MANKNKEIVHIETEEKKQKRNPILVRATVMFSISGLLLIVAGFALSSLGFFHMIGGWFIPRGEVIVGVISEEGQIKTLDDKDIVYRMNSDVVFEHVFSQGTIMLENPAVSKHNLQFSFYLPNNINDPIYSSPTLKPGECILSDKLTDTLPLKKGNYTCMCVVRAYNSAGEYLGRDTCTVIIQILDN